MKNKTLLMTIAILIIAMSAVAQKTDTFTDSRDSKSYKTVKIGTQTWMSENLAYKASSGCWAYDNDVTNVAKYGYLYNWETAKVVCPAGWHVPTDVEWSTLTDYLENNGYGYQGSRIDIAKSMAAKSGWTIDSKAGNVGNDQVSNNSTGFTALPSGSRNIDGTFVGIGGFSGTWWSTTEGSVVGAWARCMMYSFSSVLRGSQDGRFGFSVRCLKDN